MLEDAPLEHELHNLGNDCYRSGQFEKAVEFYCRAIEENGRMVETFFNRALAYARLGEYDAALNDATYVIEQNASLHDAYYLRGRIHELRLDDRAALADYDRAISLNPDFHAAVEQRATVVSREWTYRDLRNLRAQIAIEPGNAYLCFQFGQRLLLIGHVDDAIRYLETARELGFAFGDLWGELGNAYRQSRQPVKAIAAFRQAIRVNPTDVASCAHLGQLLTESGHFRDAVQIFRRALGMPGDDVAALFCGLGAALYGLRKWEEAREAFQRALDTEPRLPDAAAGMGLIAWRLGDRARAAQWCRAALELSPGATDAIVLSVNLALSEGALATAMEMLYEVFQANSEDHRLAYVLWTVDTYARKQPGFLPDEGSAVWARRRKTRETARRVVRSALKHRNDLSFVQRDLCDELLASCPVCEEAAEALYQKLITAGNDVLAVLYREIRQPALVPSAERLQGAACVARMQDERWLADVCLAYADVLVGTPEAPRVEGLARVLTRLSLRGVNHAEGIRDLYRFCLEGTRAGTVHTMIGLAPRVFRLALTINKPPSILPETGEFLIRLSEWLERFERAARWVLPAREWPEVGDELAELRNNLIESVPAPEGWALASVLTNFGSIARHYVPIN
ncbi:MAG TPA: tetratricopeptide repeat protein [Candidatus Latescibacteria bacterium]|nr:tetratricopeptide repeat protein [Candidatus Latescibacterota bacterium]